MQRLCNDDLWSKRAAAARPSVQRFAWSRVVEQVEGELVEAVHRKRAESA